MIGWIVICDKNYVLNKKDEYEYMLFDYGVIARKIPTRFQFDTVFAADESLCIVLDGVILNLKELKEKYQEKSTFFLIKKMFQQDGKHAINNLIGPFSGFIYDKQTGQSFVFGNQTGDSPVFYTENDICMYSTDINWIIEYMKLAKVDYSLSEEAVKYMLTYGFMIDNKTFFRQIKRVLPGNVLQINFITDQKEEKKYFEFPKKKEFIDIKEVIEVLDQKFRIAVKRCIEKDLEYGYHHHLCDISGGIDSRVVNWVIHDLGIQHVTNICYSKAEERDYKYSIRVSQKLKNEFFFRSMDDLSFMAEIDQIVNQNYGLGYYIGITAGRQMLESLNFKTRFGLEITGQVGDAIVGCFDLSKGVSHYRNSSTLQLGFKEIECVSDDGIEERIMTIRGFLGCLSTHLIRRNYTYTVSPFLDKEFFEYCMSIPAQYRANHKLYYMWLKEKYPESLRIPSTRAHTKLDRIGHYSYRLWEYLLYYMKIRKTKTSIKGMTPIDYWYQKDKKLQKFLGDYWDLQKNKINNSELQKILNQMWDSVNFMDKAMVLTIAGVLKKYF